MYLDAKLNIHQMFLLYSSECQKNNIAAQKEHVYREIFHNEFNLGFHRPKKDLCSLCEKAKLGQISDDVYQDHLERKEVARNEKSKAKEDATNDPALHAACFDLEQVNEHSKILHWRILL